MMGSDTVLHPHTHTNTIAYRDEHINNRISHIIGAGNNIPLAQTMAKWFLRVIIKVMSAQSQPCSWIYLPHIDNNTKTHQITQPATNKTSQATGPVSPQQFLFFKPALIFLSAPPD